MALCQGVMSSKTVVLLHLILNVFKKLKSYFIAAVWRQENQLPQNLRPLAHLDQICGDHEHQDANPGRLQSVPNRIWFMLHTISINNNE